MCGGPTGPEIKEIINEKEYDIFRCHQCDVEFLYPQPSIEDLDREYDAYHKKRHDGIENAKVPHFDKLLSLLNIDFNGKTVLDAGGAEGDCAKALLKRNPRVSLHLIEPYGQKNPFENYASIKYYATSLEEYINLGEQSNFDYIFLFDVIEHLRHPMKILHLLVNNLLHDEGIIIATFPNCESLSRRLMGRHWIQFKLEHLYYFSDQSIRIAEERTGLQRICLRRLGKYLPVEYLVNVGKNFGPVWIRRTVTGCQYLIPAFIKRKRLNFYYGEWLWVAQKAVLKD